MSEGVFHPKSIVEAANLGRGRRVALLANGCEVKLETILENELIAGRIRLGTTISSDRIRLKNILAKNKRLGVTDALAEALVDSLPTYAWRILYHYLCSDVTS